MSSFRLGLLATAVSILAASPARADPYAFSTGSPDGVIATASRPASGGKTGVETADDFVLAQTTSLTGASFTGLLTSGATLLDIGAVSVEIYRVFASDSNTARTPAVPSRTQSPADVAFDSRASGVAGQLAFVTTLLTPSFTASNSVLSGINKAPNQRTGGEGAISGQEVRFDVTFSSALTLAADHYFFVPQVQVAGGDFYWLSAPNPGSGPSAFAPDLQSWIRNDGLDPDWLRVGTDITGAGPYNAAFSLTGTVAAVPEQETWALMLVGLLGLAGSGRARSGRSRLAGSRA